MLLEQYRLPGYLELVNQTASRLPLILSEVVRLGPGCSLMVKYSTSTYIAVFCQVLWLQLSFLAHTGMKHRVHLLSQ
jgi:hypothetical protein